MCGIFGSVGADLDVEAGLRALRHRGPDATGVHRGDGVVLGHTRLAVIELSPLGAQPMASSDGRVLVVFNGEIYNHRALRAELERDGHAFRSRSDTEAIVEGYGRWGEGVVERLDGMFAFALWDTREKTLLLARDRTGKKPLFYAERDGALYFASEPKALGVTRRFDASRLPTLLALGYVPAPETIEEGVRALEPASTLVWREGMTRVRRYWRAPFFGSTLSVSVSEAAKDVRRLVERAVEKRLEADVPLGAFLSGGIDSSIIACVMQRKLGRRVRTFSIGFSGDARYDETHYARLAARAFDTEHEELTVGPQSFELIERLVDAHDGPFGDASAIPASIVAELARRSVTVALSGDGGDELFAGYTRFIAALAAERVPSALRLSARMLAERLPRGKNLKGLYTRGTRFLRSAALPLAQRLYAWSGYFTDDLAHVLRADRAWDFDAPRRYSVAAAEGRSSLSRILAHNFATYLPYDLLVKADRSSMMHSLELRSPFLDTELIEYVARLPDRMKTRGLDTKRILKRAFADVLPKEILRRGKMGFGVPLGAWFRRELRAPLRDHLAPRARLYDYLERDYVERLLDEHDRGRADHGLKLWLLLTLEVWLKRPRV